MRYLSIIFLILSFLSAVYAETDAEFYLRKGKVELENDMFDYARENLTLSFRYDPNLYETSALLGDLYLRKGDRLRALEFYLTSLSLNDAQDMTHTKAGEIDDFYTRYDDALKHFLRATELNAANHRALIGASHVYGVQNNREKADTYFIRAYESCKGRSDPVIKEANRLYSLKKYPEAAEKFKTALEMNPADSELYFTIEKIERLLRNSRGALAVMERYTYLRPLDGRGWITLAEIYYSERSYKDRQRELVQASLAAEKAIAISPDYPEYHELAADIYSSLGDRKNESLHRAYARKILP